MPIRPCPPAVEHRLWHTWWNRAHAEDIRPYGAPSYLHHYVRSCDALLSILTSRVLWASDARHLKDTTELTHALPMCDTALDAISDPYLLEHAAIVKDALREQLRHRIYIACLSSANDIASQWNDYANQQRGFCITFDNLLLSSLSMRPGIRIMPVEYGEAAQCARTRRAVDRAVADIAALPYTTQLERFCNAHARFTLLAVELLYFCASFKAESYRPEREWRLIYALQGDEAEALPVRTRDSSGEPLPYVELPLTRTYVGHPIPTCSAVRAGGRVDTNKAALAQKCLRDFTPETRWEMQQPLP